MRGKLILVLFAISASARTSCGAQWIAVDAARPTNGVTTAVFAREVTNAARVASAKWTVSGCGVFEAYANGSPFGVSALKPGYTHSTKRRQSFTRDVTALVDTAAGARNVFAAEVSRGWWNDGLMATNAPSAFWCELEFAFEDGRREVVTSDGGWKAAYAGPVTDAGIYEGEIFDARVGRGWMRCGVPAEWRAAVPTLAFGGRIVPLKGPPVVSREDLKMKPVAAYAWKGAVGASGTNAFGRVRKIRTFAAGEPLTVRPGETVVVDFGQNAAGRERFTARGGAGVTLTVRHGEMLNESNGELSRGNDGPAGSVYLANLRGIPAATHYTFSGSGDETYAPSFTFYGFRYLSITADGEVEIKSIESVPLSSVRKEDETGRLVTGDKFVNRLLSNIRWGHLSNYLSVPTDCPQRNERMGWSADTWVFAPVACHLADCSGFLSKWMDDMSDSRTKEGLYAFLAPDSRWSSFDGFGWSDAGVIVPHLVYRMYGDRKVVADNYEEMKGYVRALARTDGLPRGREGWQFGDWLAFEQVKGTKNGYGLNRVLSLAFWIWDEMLMRDLAEVLGKKNDAAEFASAERAARERFKAECLQDDGTIRPEYRCQTADVYALYLDLVEGPAFKATADDLAANIREHGNRLQTGFLGTALLLQALDKAGLNGLAWTLLLQRECPSWLYSVDQGATTVWERWNSYTRKDGFGPVGMNSFNHYAYGVVERWLWESAAGIRCEIANPGFRRFTLAPHPDRGIGFVDASFRSRAGLIESRWRYGEDGCWTWTFTVPAGATATVRLPELERRLVYADGRRAGDTFTVTGGTQTVTAVPRTTVACPATGFWILPRQTEHLQDIAAEKSRHFNVVMVGDSITECWKYDRGRDVQKRLLGDFRILNLGCAGDTTQNCLWRFDCGMLDGYTADAFMVMIGTNNVGSSPEDVAAGVKAILDRIRAKHPESRILLLPIFPMASAADAADRARKSAAFRGLADGETVVWHDFTRRFYDGPGTISREILVDGQHPNVRAHEIWAEEVRPFFERFVREADARRGTVTVEVKSGGYIAAAVKAASARRRPGERAEVVLDDGVYEVTNTITLGTSESHLTLRAKHPGRATVVGGRAFRGRDFRPVSDAAILRRLPEASRKQVRALALSPELAARFRSARHTGGGQWTYRDWNNYDPKRNYPNFPNLTVDARQMDLARWPNRGEWLWIGASNVVDRGTGGKGVKFATGTGRERAWRIDGQNIGAAGWIENCTYLNCCTAVTGRDPETGALVLEKAKPSTDFGRVFFFNIPEELDSPGEWCFDAASGQLLLLPPEGFGPDSVIAVGSTEDILFHLTGDCIDVQGLTVTGKSFHPAVVIDGAAAGNEIRGCRFSGIGYDCIWMAGRRNAVRDCDLEDVLSMGIGVQGGDLKTMFPAQNVVDNNRLRRCERLNTTWAKGAIYVDGVGNRVSHNVISDMPDGGLYLAGFDHVLEYNRVYDVCREFDDVGVAYSPGGQRCYGITFRYNDLSGRPGQCAVLYYDDTSSGHTAYGNVLRNAGADALLIGGGRDNHIYNNLLVGGFTGINLDNRGLFWPSYLRLDEASHRAAFAKRYDITNQTAAIVRKYPKFAAWYTNPLPINAPADNVFERNIIVDPAGYGSCLTLGGKQGIPDGCVTWRDNLIVRTKGGVAGHDLILHPEDVATNEYSRTIPSRPPIGESRLLDGTSRRPLDLGFRYFPEPQFDPLPYFGYAPQNWISLPVLYPLRKSYFKGFGIRKWEKGDFGLKPESRIFKEVPGWEPIPFDEIGLYATEWRKDTCD